MSEHNDRHEVDTDPQVSSAYRRLSDERTPPALDREVLKRAALATKNTRFTQSAWLRPLAFAATLVLGVALLFEMQPSPEPTATPYTSAEESPVAASGNTESSNKPRQVRDMAPVDAAALPRRTEADREEALYRRRMEVSPEAVRQSLPETAAPLAESAGQAGKYCGPEDTASVDAWWACIDALKKAGEAESAEAEIHRLHTHHPQLRDDR